ncbi:MAG: monovalent cation/H(+) antiporter subunit G [Dehalococcoidia bacterium]
MESLYPLSYVFIGIGLFFNLVGVFGLHRFPDMYTRLHAATKCTTFGAIFLILAVIVQSAGIWSMEGAASSQSAMTIRAVLAVVALLVTNATGAHAIARAAHRSGEKPAGAVVDDLEAKEEEEDD